MTLKEFFITIQKAGDIRESREKITLDIYKYAGIVYVSESTILANVKGTRKSKYDKDSINESGFVKYFMERTRSTWKNMQKAFCAIDEYNIIDCATKEEEEFYRSMLNLFYELHRIPWTKESLSEQMLEIFIQAIDDCHIEDFINSDPGYRLADDLLGEAEQFLNIIKHKIIIPFSKHRDMEMYIKVHEFAEILLEYIQYLSYHMRPSYNMNGTYVPLFGEENIQWLLDFAKETLNYRQRIFAKYQEIYGNE